MGKDLRITTDDDRLAEFLTDKMQEIGYFLKESRASTSGREMMFKHGL